MVATLDDYMNGNSSAPSNIGTLDDYMKNGATQSNSVTTRITTIPKNPQTASAPVNKDITVGEGIGNLGTAIGEGIGNFAQTVIDNPIGFAKDTANSLIIQPVKEFGTNVLNPDVTKSPWLAMGGGVAKGAVALPQNLWNMGVDAVNAYNATPGQNQYKAHYVEDIAKAMQGNQFYQDMYQKPKQANETISELSSFAAPMSVVGKVAKTANAIQKTAKVADETNRIASKLNEAQKIKYANQIRKLAQSNVDKGVSAKTALQQLPGNVTTGFGLGALEGDTLQERAANGAGVAALGGALSLAHAGAGKALNSERGLKLRQDAKEALKNLTTDYDKASQIVAGIDNSLNTNLSDSASDLTKTRKKYSDLISKDQNYKRNISDEERQLLDEAGKLSDEQQTEIFERNKYGARERALRISKDVKAELAKQNEQPEVKQEPETTVKSQEEADKWFKEREEFVKKLDESKKAWEEQQKEHSSKDDLSQVKSETDINTPKDIKTLENEQQTKAQNDKLESIKPKLKDNQYIDEDGNIVTRLEQGNAEGSEAGDWYTHKSEGKVKKLGDEDLYEMSEVEGTKPTTDEELMQEIEVAKTQKDVPVVRSEKQIDTRSASKRKFDRIHNEIRQKSWYKQLKNKKVKSLNDETKEKTMAEMVFSNGEAHSPSHYDVRKAASENSTEKIDIFNDKIDSIVKEKESKASKLNNDKPDWVKNLLRSIDNSAIKDVIKNIKNTKFSKADRSFSYKLTDFADEVSKGNSGIEQAVKEFLDDVTYEFGNIEGHGEARLNSRHFVLNSKDSVQRQYVAFMHETHHFIAEEIAKACGKDSSEYKIMMEAKDINNKMFAFEEDHPKEVAMWRYFDALRESDKVNNTNKARDFLSILSDEKYDALVEYNDLYCDYTKVLPEKEAVNTKNGQWTFYGKDITEYADILRSYREGTGKVQQGYNAKTESNVEQGKGKLSKDKSGDSRNVDGSYRNGEGQDSSNDRLADRNSKLIHRTLDWFDKTKNKHTKFYHQFLEATPEIKKFTDAFKTINDKREAFFREFGTYTDERMKARLFKQSKSGEGVYFQQGTKRNEKVVWGKESNNKVGFTGKKELEGVSERGTTQEGLARGFSDIVRMEHTRNCINFLKENFGKQQEGFIPVNSKLLANAMYFGKSKAWYETIRKGQEAIDKTFDEKNAKEWNELYKTTEADKSDIYLPKDLLDLTITGEKELPLDYLATYGKVRGTKGKIKGMAKVAGAMLDFYTDRFKRKVLTSASFFTNNRFGNQIMLAMTADKPQDYIKGIADAFRLKESEVPTEILESTLAEAVQKEANSGIRKYFSEKNNTFDNIARILDGDEIDTKTLSGLSKTVATASNWIISKPNALFRGLSKLTGEINERFERFERKQAFSQALSKMQRNKVLKNARQFAGLHELAEVAKKDKLIREAVIDKVADALGDYNNFNKTERNFLKKLIPFYAWNRTITRHIVHLTKDNPVKATLVAYETYRLLNQDDGLEDYQHGSLKTGLYNSRTKSNVVINKASMIPYNTLLDMVSGESIGSFSPLITKPLEAVRGEKFFKPASEITSKTWKRTTQDNKKGYVNTKTGEFREGKAPIGSRVGYIAKDAMETVYPMAGSPMTKGIPDAVKHYNQTGELLFPDKQYDSNLGGFYDGDKAGKTKSGKKVKDRKLSAKNRLDFKYQVANRTLGLGIQPEHKVNSKEQKEKYNRQRKRMRGF